jgi:hypothetical protein
MAVRPERRCAGTIECMLEVRETLSGHDRRMLLILGAHWKLSESLALLVAPGREFGSASADRQRPRVYLGIRLRR